MRTTPTCLRRLQEEGQDRHEAEARRLLRGLVVLNPGEPNWGYERPELLRSDRELPSHEAVKQALDTILPLGLIRGACREHRAKRLEFHPFPRGRARGDRFLASRFWPKGVLAALASREEPQGFTTTVALNVDAPAVAVNVAICYHYQGIVVPPGLEWTWLLFNVLGQEPRVCRIKTRTLWVDEIQKNVTRAEAKRLRVLARRTATRWACRQVPGCRVVLDARGWAAACEGYGERAAAARASACAASGIVGDDPAGLLPEPGGDAAESAGLATGGFGGESPDSRPFTADGENGQTHGESDEGDADAERREVA